MRLTVKCTFELVPGDMIYRVNRIAGSNVARWNELLQLN